MGSFKPHYAGLCQYLTKNFGERWKQIEGEISLGLREYTTDRYINRRPKLPPVIFFTAKQRQLYTDIFLQIQDVRYQDLAAEIIGRPIPEPNKDIALVDLITNRKAPTRIFRFTYKSKGEPPPCSHAQDDFWRGN